MSRRKVKLPAHRAGRLRFSKEISKPCDTKVSCLAEAGGERNDTKRYSMSGNPGCLSFPPSCFAVEYIGYSVVIFLYLAIASARVEVEESAV